MNQTSRSFIIDAIEFITNQIWLTSHYQEIIFSLQQEIEELPVQDSATIAEISLQIDEIEQLLSNSISLRRDMMTEIWSQYPNRKEMRCAVKHVIANYGYSCELYYANLASPSRSFYRKNMINSYRQMIATVSLWLWLDWIEICWRCMADALESQGWNTEEDNTN